VRSFDREVRGTSLGPAGELGAEFAVRVARGQVVAGLRYLASPVGRLSSGDEILGNPAGMIGDLGYRLAW
jgi:hypothetical protein